MTEQTGIRHRRTGDLDTTVSRLKAENEHLRWQVEQALDQLLSGKHYDAEATLEAALAGSSGAPSA